MVEHYCDYTDQYSRSVIFEGNTCVTQVQSRFQLRVSNDSIHSDVYGL